MEQDPLVYHTQPGQRDTNGQNNRRKNFTAEEKKRKQKQNKTKHMYLETRYWCFVVLNPLEFCWTRASVMSEKKMRGEEAGGITRGEEGGFFDFYPPVRLLWLRVREFEY